MTHIFLWLLFGVLVGLVFTPMYDPDGTRRRLRTVLIIGGASGLVVGAVAFWLSTVLH